MSLLWSKNGFRGEYIARYIVSRFAFISESNVSEDYGIDFYCGLIKDALDKQYVHYDKPFLLQIKTKTSPETKSKPQIVYEGENKIHTLFNLSIPFFIGYLDLDKKVLDIHSTSPMWYTYIQKRGNISKVTFCFREDESTEAVWWPKIKKMEVKDYQSGDGDNNIIDLGHPIISVSVSDLESKPALIQEIRNILSKVIDRDNDNLVNKRLNLHFTRWAHIYETNSNGSFRFGFKYFTKEDGLPKDFFNPQHSLDSLHYFLLSLAVVFDENGMEEEFQKVCQITKHISKSEWLDDMIKLKPEVYGLKKTP